MNIDQPSVALRQLSDVWILLPKSQIWTESHLRKESLI